MIGRGDGMIARTDELAALALFLHLFIEADRVDVEALLTADDLRQIERKAEGVVKLKGDLPGQHPSTV